MTRPAALLAALAVSLAPAAAAPAAPPSAPARTAIVVGANAAALGRSSLRHAHRDSDAIADVLRSVGRFEARRVHVLHDPTPDEVVALVEREAAALAGNPQGMLLFYYSGHADRDALYPGGKALALDRLRRVLDRPDVAVRVGVIDACQGGAWTRAKGLVPDAPFEVTMPAVLGSEGSALIASSSGVESAHESDLLQGSFFTYHFAAALRGAGDQSGDGAVTLTEAFEYARERTIRDSARLSPEPQHPSYALNVRGRQDIVLAHLADSPSTLAVEQQEGPLELVHLASGLRVLELPAGRRSVTLAVPPGKYLVRRVGPEGIRTRELDVPRDGAVTVREVELVLLGSERLAVKGGARHRTPPEWPLRGGGEVEIGFETTEKLGAEYVGIGTGDDAGVGGMLRIDGRLGLTDRLVWKVGTLAFSYRLGEPGGVEAMPYAGLLSWKLPYRGDTDVPALGGIYRGAREYRLGAGIGARVPFSAGALVFTLGADRATVGSQTGTRYQGGLGITVTAGRYLTLHVSAGMTRYEFPDLVIDTIDPDTGWRFIGGYGGQATVTWVGSSQELGLASIPVVRAGPWRGWSLDLYGGAEEYRRVWYRAGIARAF